MIRACCECAKHLPDELKHLAIIGCRKDGVAIDCVDCEETESCSIRLVYPDDASHGFCDACFDAAMRSLNERRAKK